MTGTIAHRIGRYVVLPAISAGILGGAAVGLAGMANASPAYQPEPRPGIVATPTIKARPPVPAPRPRVIVVAPSYPSGGGFSAGE